MKIKLLFFLFIIASTINAAQPSKEILKFYADLTKEAQQQGVEDALNLWTYLQNAPREGLAQKPLHHSNNLLKEANHVLALVASNSDLPYIPTQSSHEKTIFFPSKSLVFPTIKHCTSVLGIRNPVGASIDLLEEEAVRVDHYGRNKLLRNAPACHILRFSQKALGLFPTDLKTLMLRAMVSAAQYEQQIAPLLPFALYVLKNAHCHNQPLVQASSRLAHEAVLNGDARVAFLSIAQAKEFGEYLVKRCLELNMDPRLECASKPSYFKRIALTTKIEIFLRRCVHEAAGVHKPFPSFYTPQTGEENVTEKNPPLISRAH